MSLRQEDYRDSSGKKLTSTPRTQGPDFCAFLMHCRVDGFLNSGYVYQREFEWR